MKIGLLFTYEQDMIDLITWLKHAIFFAAYVATNFVATSN